MLNTILDNEYFWMLVTTGAGWLVNKVLGKRADSKAGKVAAALATASAEMLQLAITAPSDMTASRLMTQYKGVVAVQLAKIGIYEKDRAPFQPLIDAAISAAVTEWVKRHPTPSSLSMPRLMKLSRDSS